MPCQKSITLSKPFGYIKKFVREQTLHFTRCMFECNVSFFIKSECAECCFICWHYYACMYIPYYRTPSIIAQCRSTPIKIVALIPMLINADHCRSPRVGRRKGGQTDRHTDRQIMPKPLHRLLTQGVATCFLDLLCIFKDT